jgi:hypothetical protein
MSRASFGRADRPGLQKHEAQWLAPLDRVPGTEVEHESQGSHAGGDYGARGRREGTEVRRRPEDFKAAFHLPLLGAEEARRRLKSVYFDTGDSDLMRHGVTLRVRKQNGTNLMGLKRAARSKRGFFDRDELEVTSPSGGTGSLPVRRDDREQDQEDHRRAAACGEIRLRHPQGEPDGQSQRRGRRGRAR